MFLTESDKTISSTVVGIAFLEIPLTPSPKINLSKYFKCLKSSSGVDLSSIVSTPVISKLLISCFCLSENPCLGGYKR